MTTRIPLLVADPLLVGGNFFAADDLAFGRSCDRGFPLVEKDAPGAGGDLRWEFQVYGKMGVSSVR